MTMCSVPRKCYLNLFIWITVIHTCAECESGANELKLFISCNSILDMESQNLYQGELHLTISELESSGTRVSCDFTVHAGTGKNVMFYFTELYLGSPNRTGRIDQSCIEPRDVNGHYEHVPSGMMAIICSATEVETGNRVYSTTGSSLSIRFYRNRGFAVTVNFKMVFTSFRLGSCRTSERKCKNDRCIAHDIVCNNHNPCGDYSDCPTGLEHLSNWEISGILILALLFGGIMIIMASVCLRRTRSKRFDWYDLERVPVNGSIEQDHNQVEMNAVIIMQQRCPNGYTDRRRHKRKQYQKNERVNNCLLLQECSPSLNEPPLENDKEKLIHPNRSSQESSPAKFRIENKFRPVDICSEKTQDRLFNCHLRSLKNDSLNRELSSFHKYSPFMSNSVSHSFLHACSSDRCHSSNYSLIYSESEGRGGNKIQVASLERTKPHNSYLKSSSLSKTISV